MYKINWDKISDEKTFQRLVNHLFALECNSPGFIPSSPYIGADGGWDGYYNGLYGLYPKEKKEGIYSIQSKWTTKNLKGAVKILKPQIKKELDKAQKNEVEYLKIATNAKLKTKHILELESLNEKKVKDLKIWHRENLTIRIEKQPWLRYYFFDYPQHPLLTPYENYFSTVEPFLASFPSIETNDFEKYMTKIKQFISSNNKLLLIHSPGGYGKSHLLREIAQNAYQIDYTRQTWLVNAGYRDIKDAIQDEFFNDRRYLLIYDDADRYFESESVKPLLDFLRKGDVDIKLILSLRSSGIYLLQRLLEESKRSEITEEIKIVEWKRDDLIKLLRATAGKSKVKDEESIAVYYPNPYIIVWIGSQLKGKAISDISKLKEKFVGDINYEVRQCLKDEIDKEIEKFVFVLACIIPINIEDKELLDKIGTEIGLDFKSITKAISRLIEAGLLRKIGRTVRFNPDMKGDIYLQYKLKDFDRGFLKDFVLKWISIYPENIFTNIGSASRYGESNIVKEILSEFLDKWIKDADKTPGSQRQKNLNLIGKVVFLVPKKVLNLLFSYFECSSPPETDPNYKRLNMEKIELNTDDYGPVILELMKIPSFEKEVICIIEKMAGLNIIGTYNNYKPSTLISEYISPLKNNLEVILSKLDIFNNWLDNPNNTRIILLGFSLSELLAGTHRFSESSLGGLTLGERPLIKHPKVIKVRRKAIFILKRMLSSNNLDMQISSIEITKNIGKTIMGRYSEEDLPLFGIFIEERRDLIEEIGRLINSKTDFKLLSEIEKLFTEWWAQEKPGTENVVNFLRKFPYSDEYLIFRWFYSEEYDIKKFSDYENLAPKENKWDWFAKNIMSFKWQVKIEYFSSIVEELNKKYKNEYEILIFLNDLDERLSTCKSDFRALFIIWWIKINPKVFRKIRENNKLWVKVPDRFKDEIDKGIVAICPDHLSILANEILDNPLSIELSKIDLFLMLIAENLPESKWKMWIKELIKKGNTKIRATIASRLYFIFKKNKDVNTILDFLIDIFSIEKEPESILIKSVYFYLKEINKAIDDSKELYSKKIKLTEIFLKMLKDYPSLSREAQEVLEFCDLNIDEMIDLIDYRLKKEKATVHNRTEFKAIPHKGIKYLEKSINSFEDYYKFLKKCILWSNAKLFSIDLDIENLFKPIVSKKEKDSKETYLIKSIKELLKENLINEALISAEILPLSFETTDLFLEISHKGIKNNLYKEVRYLLFHKTLPQTRIWMFSPGKTPQIFLEIKNIFKYMLKKTNPGRLNNLIGECIEIIDKGIEDDLERDEEYLNPRQSI
ncbi:hypothetical protein ES704_00659 [subsurface metagenome]